MLNLFTLMYSCPFFFLIISLSRVYTALRLTANKCTCVRIECVQNNIYLNSKCVLHMVMFACPWPWIGSSRMRPWILYCDSKLNLGISISPYMSGLPARILLLPNKFVFSFEVKRLRELFTRRCWLSNPWNQQAWCLERWGQCWQVLNPAPDSFRWSSWGRSAEPPMKEVLLFLSYKNSNIFERIDLPFASTLKESSMAFLRQIS